MDGDDDVSAADVSGGGGAAVTALDDSSDEGSCNPMVMTARQDFQEEDMGGSTKIGDSSASRLRRYSSSRSDQKRSYNHVCNFKTDGVLYLFFRASEAYIKITAKM